MKKLLIFLSMLIVPWGAFSEDTELYISDAVKKASAKRQVLIIFDNSGSMTLAGKVKDDYDPDKEGGYPVVIPSDNSLQDDFVYFTKGGVDNTGLPVPGGPNEHRRFLDEVNGCDTSKEILNTVGFYTGYIREYSTKGKSGTWQEVPDNEGANIVIIDCLEDILAENEKNADGVGVGYPVDNKTTGTGKNQEATPYGTLTEAESGGTYEVEWATGQLVTLYTADYLRYYHAEFDPDVGGTSKTRLEQAKTSIKNIVQSAPGIEFGLQVFNFDKGDEDTDGNGGRIVFDIQNMTDASQATLIDIVDNDIVAATNTPLCESLYEASLYFAGKPVDFGDDDISDNDTGYKKDEPPLDSSAVNGSNYISPYPSCSSTAYVIIITDGLPSFDSAADTKIEALTGINANGDTKTFAGTKVQGSYLAGLAEWMNGTAEKYGNLDINASKDKIQNVKTFTVGFNLGSPDDLNNPETEAYKANDLLTQTAEAGGGNYYYAENEAELTTKLIAIFSELTPSNQSLTSASVAANNFDRTQTLNSVYYAMFDPEVGPRWQGNLKKYKVVNGVQVGANDEQALNDAGTHFSEDVKSFWSSDVDGDKVEQGGVADKLRGMAVGDRKILSDVGDGGALDVFNKTNLLAAYSVTSDAAALATEFGVPEDEIDDYINWAKGMDVDDEDGDEDKTDMRFDVFADPLHSKPVVVNYGDSIRILVGTNAGVLHMFHDKGSDVIEDWAFMPKEFLSIVKQLRENIPDGDKVYGIDGKITLYTDDKDGDGIIESGDKAWIFFGLRRGGTSYYGLDITDPANPDLLWHNHAEKSGFINLDLGQSWSQPKVIFSKIKASDTVASPVLVIGGGYDTKKDAETVGGLDTVGRAVYMVDAESGSLLWSAAPSGATTTFSGTDSIPSSIATLDSDADGLTDRLYFGDTGGNVWRVDMPGSNPSDTDNPWTIFKLAELGGTTDATDRRFFNEPSIVRTFISETLETEVTDVEGVTTTIVSKQEIPYDAVLIGSGNRTHPLGENSNTQDMLFMLKDKHIKTQAFEGDDIPATLKIGDLYDFSSNPFGQTLTTAARSALEIAVSKKSGWYIDFSTNDEQSTSTPLVINGVAYFTSFIPPSLTVDADSCEVPSGQGWLYAVDLALGYHIYNWSEETSPEGNDDDRKVYISEQYLGSPTLIVLPDEESNKSEGNIIVGRRIIPVGFELDTSRNYLYTTEEQ